MKSKLLLILAIVVLLALNIFTISKHYALISDLQSRGVISAGYSVGFYKKYLDDALNSNASSNDLLFRNLYETNLEIVAIKDYLGIEKGLIKIKQEATP